MKHLLLLALLLHPACSDPTPLASAQESLDPTRLNPGHTLELGGAIVGDLPCVRFHATCQVDNERFQARTVAVHLPFARGKAGVFRAYEFSVAGDAASHTVLEAQLGGKAQYNGFLGLIGGGTAASALRMKVLDLGPDFQPFETPRVICCEELAAHALHGSVVAGAGVGISGEAGTTFTGGVSLDLDLALQIQKELVRDELEFGCHVLLTRGHRYRVQFDLSAESKLNAAGGLAIAQFMEGGPVLNLLLPENWRGTLRALLDPDFVPAFDAADLISDNIKPSFHMPRLDVFGGSIVQQLFVPGSQEQETGSATITTNNFWNVRFQPLIQHTREKLVDLGLPVDLHGLLDVVDEHIRNRTAGHAEEALRDPGVQVLQLFVTLENDQVELLRELQASLAQ